MIEMTGANSPSGLAGSPCRVVVLDEVGKFPLQTGIEADAVNLAHQRVKDFSQSLVVTTSTPVLVSSPEWQEYLKGDQRRYHVPCVHCGKLIVFAWSAELNSMPRLGCEAYVHWDQKAKLGNKWDYLEVRNSAHFVCPFCNGKIFEREKREMIKKGEWIATNRNGDEAFRSYHISSLYACSSSATNLGNEAVKFLKEKRAQRLQGFVNGELAEPWSYVASVKRSELILSASVKHEGEWFRFLTADYHLNEPFLWWVVREWNLKGDSHLINFGSMNSFKELEEVQKMYQIPDSQVFIDSGFNAQRVYEECLLRGKREPYPPNGIGYRRERNVPPVWVHFGWTPVKGYTTQKNWYDEETGIPVVFSWAEASILSDDIALPVLQFSTSQLKDMLRAMRLRETEQIWAVTDIVDKRSSVYWQHLDAEEVKEDSRGKFFWEKKHSRLPNHLLDCEVYQVGAAVAFEILKIKEEECESV